MTSTQIAKSDLTAAYAAIKGQSIPSIPQTLMSLQQELSGEEPDQSKVISLISEDISLSGKVLQSINSAAYGLKHKVSSIDHAAALLGIRNLRDTIVSSALRLALEKSLPGFESITDFSNQIGLAARFIAKEINLDDPEAAFIVGLFHKAGTMMLMQKSPEYQAIYEQYHTRPVDLVAQEKQIFNTSYPLVSFILAHHWKLPETVTEAVAFHLSPIDEIQNKDVANLVATFQVAAHILLKDEEGFDNSAFYTISKSSINALNISDETLSRVYTSVFADE